MNAVAGRGLDARAVVARHRRARRVRPLAVSLVLAGLAVLVFAVSLSVGDFPVPLLDVLPAALGVGGEDYQFIVQELRLPRSVAAVLVGMAFGLSGAVIQSLARNPLASPDILGITAGGSAAAVATLAFITATYAWIALAAFLGSVGMALAIYVLAWRDGVSGYRFVLIGIAMGAIALAVISYVLSRAQFEGAAQALVWTVGSLNSRSWSSVVPVALAMVVLVPLMLAMAGPLQALALGDDTAKGLGVRVERSRLALVVVAVALAGVGAAVGGPISFVAFLSAPIARRLVRAPVALVPSALVGAVLVLAADLFARRAFAPTEIPVGIVTAIVGAPYLLWLLARANRIGRGG